IGLWKFSPFLPLSILVLYQACILQVVPFRSALESLPDPAVLPEEESRLLLAALVKDYVRMKVRALEQETEGASPRAKRCSNLSTCVLGTYPQDLNKSHNFRTFSGIGFRAETPGKKKDTAICLERDH
uniref:Calcitonin n=1 Tax=Equus asinus asinus TaxID=83772 RepID=A0A8C4LDZ2_EQUAS